MPNLTHHERLFRGSDIVDRLADVRVTVCGAGALGSQLTDTLARQGFQNLRIIDHDRVEEHNVGTQVYGLCDVGVWKVEALRSHVLLRKSCDVLLIHGAPQGIGGESDRFGSAMLRDVVETLQPEYHVFGHHSRSIPRTRIHGTDCVWLNDTNFSKTRDGVYNGPLESGCTAVLRWRSSDDHDLTVIDDDWFRRTTGATWRHY